MTLSKLISSCLDRNIRLWPDGTKIRWRAPKGAMTNEILEGFRRYRQVLLAMLGPDRLPDVAFLKNKLDDSKNH